MRTTIVIALSLLLTGGLVQATESAGVLAGNSLLDTGIKEYRQENYEEAVVQLQEARQIAGQSGVAAFYLGLALKQTGDLDGAREQLRSAAVMEPPVLDAYLELAELAYTQDDYSEAQKWVDLAAAKEIKPGPTAFMQGMILAKQGETTAALAAFDQAKTTAPELGQAVAMQQALLLANSRRFSEAGVALRSVISLDPASDLATYARDYEQLLQRATASHRNWHLKLGIGGIYDDNVVAKPDAAIPGLEISHAADVGFNGTLQLDYTPLLPGGWLFSGHYALQSTTYGSISTHNTIQHGVTLIPGLEFSKSSFTLPVSYTHLLLAEENYLGQVMVRPTVSMAVGAGQIVQIGGGYARREMQQPALDHDENRDADLYVVGAGYLAALGPNVGSASLRYEFSYDRTEGRNWQNRSHRLAGNWLFPLAGSITCNLGGDAVFQQYLQVHSAFGIQRDDTLVNATAGCNWGFWDGLNLVGQYTHTNAISNIDPYDYQRNQATLGLEYSF
jgi:Flp pilus assembly protein TadD